MFENLQKRANARLTKFAARLRGDDRGVAAVEFAMIVPVMFFLFVGSIEFSQALTVDRRVTQSASSSADLIARAPAEGLTEAEVDGHLRIVEQLVEPYDLTKLLVKIISVQAVDDNGTVKYIVRWSRDNNGATPYPALSEYTAIPQNLLTPPESVIIAEAKYNYTPLIFKYFITSAFDLEEKFFLKPRNASCVPLKPNQTNCTPPM